MGAGNSIEQPAKPVEEPHEVPNNGEKIESGCFIEQSVKPSAELDMTPINREKTGSLCSVEQPTKPLEELQKVPSNREKTSSKFSTQQPVKLMEEPDKVRRNYDPVMQEADLHSGVFLNQKRQKYWVDEKSGCNCFMLFARDLRIVWGDDIRYWRFGYCKESSHPDIEVAELLNVCWLEVTGKIKVSNISLGTVYKVAFVIMLKDKVYGWKVKPVTLQLKFPNGVVQERKENLQDKPRKQWLELQVGQFSIQDKKDGELEFSMLEYEGGAWKSGLIIQGVIVAPLN